MQCSVSYCITSLSPNTSPPPPPPNPPATSFLCGWDQSDTGACLEYSSLPASVLLAPYRKQTTVASHVFVATSTKQSQAVFSRVRSCHLLPGPSFPSAIVPTKKAFFDSGWLSIVCRPQNHGGFFVIVGNTLPCQRGRNKIRNHRQTQSTAFEPTSKKSTCHLACFEYAV